MASTSSRIILYAANSGATTQTPILLTNIIGNNNNNNNNSGLSTQQHHHVDNQLLAASSESDHYSYCKSTYSEAGSSPFSKNDHSDLGYHPLHWADGAHAVQLASSPDRHIFGSRPFSPASSPCRSSPNIFSPPPRGAQLAKRFDNYENSLHRRNSLSTPNSSILLQSSSLNNSANSSAKRGRPSHEEISELILTGSSAKSGIKCDVCNRVFPREKSLQAHLRTHTGERPYKCTFKDCTRAFAQSGQLRTHQRLHTGEKPFICRQDGCQNRFTHPNRKCIIHPNAGLRRILPALPPANSATKATVGKSVENASNSSVGKTTPKVALKQSSGVRNVVSVVSKPVLGNITSSVVNSPTKASTTLPSWEASPATLATARQAPIVARKSVIVGRASRKLELELNAVASAPTLSPPLSAVASVTNATRVITSTPINSEKQQQQQPVASNNIAQSSPERNRMDILGALALLEMAGVYKSSVVVSNENLAPVDQYEEEDSENRAPPPPRRSPMKSRGSPRKMRAVLGMNNH